MKKKTALLTLLALASFAANSLFCRAALGPGRIDAFSFTSARLGAGTLALALIARGRGSDLRTAGEWRAACVLFVYAAAFSFSYLRLDAGSGTLLLFGAVQVTMIGWGLKRGERPRAAVWLGIAASLGGLVLLARPGRSAPDAAGAALMTLAGVAWGVYSLLGRGRAHPLAANAGNFVRGLPIALATSAFALGSFHVSALGIALAALSGALTTGCGYIAWYAALKGLSATQAAVVQVAVPVLAAAGGVLLLGETITPRLVGAGILILGGVTLAVTARPRARSAVG